MILVEVFEMCLASTLVEESFGDMVSVLLFVISTHLTVEVPLIIRKAVRLDALHATLSQRIRCHIHGSFTHHDRALGRLCVAFRHDCMGRVIYSKGRIGVAAKVRLMAKERSMYGVKQLQKGLRSGDRDMDRVKQYSNRL